MWLTRGIDVRDAGLSCLLLAACGCAASPAPAAKPAPAQTSPATGSATSELPIELGSERDAEAEPSIAVVGDALSYAGSPVGGVGEAQLARTLAVLRAKLDAAKKYWPLEQPSAFPTTLSIELGERQRVFLLKELLSLATAAGFTHAELRVGSQASSPRVSLTLRSPEWQDSPSMTKRLHVTVAPKSRYLLTWREGSSVVSAPYQELFAAPPASLDLPGFLAQKINEEWLTNGAHRAASDPVKDIAVLHLDDLLTLDALLVVTNALGTPRRKSQVQGKIVDVPAFDLYVADDTAW